MTCIYAAIFITVSLFSRGISYAASPPNDDFESAIEISGLPASASGTNLGATLQPNEPVPLDFETQAKASVWFRWTPSWSDTVRIEAVATGSEFKPLVTVWTGHDLESLEPLGYGIAYSGPKSSLPIDVNRNVTYYIAVYSHRYSGTPTSFDLIVSPDNLSRISGTVRSGNNTRLSGISVSPYQKISGITQNFLYVGFTVNTDSNGTYSIGGLEPGTYRLEFSDWTNGNYAFKYYENFTFLESAQDIEVPAQGPYPIIDTSMESASVISGRLTGSDGTTPIAGFPIVVRPSSSQLWGWPYWISETDADGYYSIRGLPAGSFRVQFGGGNVFENPSNFITEFYDDALNWNAASNVNLEIGQIQSGIDASLLEGGRISGQVTIQDGITGLPNILVNAYAQEGEEWNQISSAISDSDGNYMVMGLATGGYRLEFKDRVGNYITEYYNDAPDLDSSADIQVIAGGMREGINSSLAKAGRINGRVTGPDGLTAIPNISVTARYRISEYGWYNYSATSDASGNFTIGGLPTGNYSIDFTDWSEAYASESYDNTSWDNATEILVIQGETVSGINASLAIAGRLAGRVTGADGQTGLPNISVEASQQTPNGWHTRWWADTDSSGNFSIGGLPRGNYRVDFRDPNGFYASEKFDNVNDWNSATILELAEGQTLDSIDASLSIAGQLKGRVTGPDGQTGLSDISVSARVQTSNGGWSNDWSASTDASGNFTIGGLPTGNYSIDFTDPSGFYASQSYDNAFWNDATVIPVNQGDIVSDINASLSIAGRIMGRVTGTDGVTGLAGISVSAYFESGGNSFWVSGNVTDFSGNFTLVGLPAGNYKVAFYDSLEIYAGNNYTTNISVSERESVSGINIALVYASRITGRVISNDKNGAINGIDVFAWGQVGESVWNGRLATTDDAGYYSIGGLQSGNYIVEFRDPKEVYQNKFYDNAVDWNSATRLHLIAGEERNSIDAILAKAFQVWIESFNPNPSADISPLGDPDSDGMCNLVEYALGNNPLEPSHNPLFFSRTTLSGFDYLQLSVDRNQDASEVQIEGLSAGSLGVETAWSNSNVETLVDSTTKFTVRDKIPIQSGGKRFMKLRFTLPD